MLAQAMDERGLGDRWCCPQLPASPREAATLARSLAEQWLAGPGSPAPLDLTVIGSSLGGYYATWLAQTLGARAVLLNPAVHAARDLATQVGAHTQYHSDEPFVFLPEYVQELADLEVDELTRPERFFLVAATGDELLDWREMRDRFAHSPHRIVEGSDHGLSDFARWMPEVLEFALAPR